MKYEWQPKQERLHTLSDSEVVRCRRTAKSMSGGVIMEGRSNMQSWSFTQKTVALNRGEGELTAVVKGSCETMLQLADDLWWEEKEQES